MTTQNIVLDIPVGSEGLTSAIDPARIRPGMLQSCQNLTFEDGTLRKEGGAAIDDPVTGALDPIIAGHDWWPNSTTQRTVVVTSNGSIIRTDATDQYTVTLKSVLSVTSVVPTFVEGGQEAAAQDRKLFIFTQNNAPQVLAADGSSATDLATPAADWSGLNQPRFGANHDGRIWAGGNANDPHRLYYSTTTDHEDYTDATHAGSLSIFPGEGDYLVGAISFKGLLIVWKYPYGIYAVDTSDPTVTNWTITRLSRSIGMAGPSAFCMIDNDVLFMDPNGNINMISAVQEFGNLGTHNVTIALDMLKFMKDNVNVSRMWDARMVYYTTKRRVEIALSSLSSSSNDARLILDLNYSDRPRFLWSPMVGCSALWLRRSGATVYPMAGDTDGIIWKLDQSERNIDSGPYTGIARLANMNFHEANPVFANTRKNGQFLELVFDPKGDHDLNVKVFWDDIFECTVTYNMGSIGTALGSFILDTDVLGGNGSVTSDKRRITGGGIRLGLEFSNSGTDQDFSVARAYLHATVGDETMPGAR